MFLDISRQHNLALPQHKRETHRKVGLKKFVVNLCYFNNTIPLSTRKMMIQMVSQALFSYFPYSFPLLPWSSTFLCASKHGSPQRPYCYLHLKPSGQPELPLYGTCASSDTQRQQTVSVLWGLGGRSKIWDIAPAALNASFKCKHTSEVLFEGRSISIVMKSTDHSKEV